METLDEIDQELIRLLQIDGRASYATMAAKVGLYGGDPDAGHPTL